MNARYREAVSHWNIVGHQRSGPLAELKCRARAAFRHEMKFLRGNGINFFLSQCYQNFKAEKAMISIIIIIYHDFLPTPRKGSYVKSDKTHTQSSRYTL